MTKVVKKSQRQLISAFRQLLEEKEYYEITVAEIICLADIGKTTFYRHYQSKLDLFVEMHSVIFDLMLQELVTREDWLDIESRPTLVALSLKAVSRSRGRTSMAHKLGSDWPYAQRLLGDALAEAIDSRLSIAFQSDEWIINRKHLASALAALYLDFLIQLSHSPSKKLAQSGAQNLQHFSRALLLAALAKKS